VVARLRTIASGAPIAPELPAVVAPIATTPTAPSSPVGKDPDLAVTNATPRSQPPPSPLELQSRRAPESCTLDLKTEVKHCVEPELQFKKHWWVHVLPPDKPDKGARFQHLIWQGLDLHPGVDLTDDPDKADVIFFMSTSTKWIPWGEDPGMVKDEYVPDPRYLPAVANTTIKQGYTDKFVVLDEGDGPGTIKRVDDGEYLAYFKRSWVLKNNGTLIKDPKRFAYNYFPMSYSVSDNYTDGFIQNHRHYHVVCTLRRNKKQPARGRILDWLEEAVETFNISHTSEVGEVNHAQRKTISRQYLDINRRAHIVVTCNPSHWEGDFRLWEAMASGALVFVDQMHVPISHPLRHKQHLILYDTLDKPEFFRLLHYYLTHPDEAREIALQGYLYAMKHHRSVTRLDYILRSADAAMATHNYAATTGLVSGSGAAGSASSAAYNRTSQMIKTNPHFLMHLDSPTALRRR